MKTRCQWCSMKEATHHVRYVSMNGESDTKACARCAAGRLAAPYTKEHEVTNMKTGGRLTEEEMEELIASRDWDAYTGTMTHCREGKHDKCPERIQPTNHIDPHPTVCSCACHEDWDEDEFDWDEDDEFEFGEDDDDEYVFD